MFDNSAYYGLKNPGFTNDIGYGMIDMMYPATAINPVSGTIDPELSQAAGMINNGQPANDTFNGQKTKSQKENNILKKVLIGGGVLIAGALAFFKLKKPVLKAVSKVTVPIKNIFTKIFNKIKPSP